MMQLMREAWRRVTFLLRRRQAQADLDEEMQFHLECRAQEAREDGARPGDAPDVARRAFGNTMALREAGLEMWGWGWLDRLAQDLRWAFRTLRRSPGFTVTAVLMLALGIGVNAAIFTLVRGQLLRPLPYPHADRLVWVFQSNRDFLKGEPIDATEASADAWAGDSRALEALGTFVPMRSILTGQGDAEELAVAAVSPELFGLLGAVPLRGRLFVNAENVPGRNQVAVLSHTLWLRRFGGSERVLGRPVTLGARSYTIIGVLPPGFEFGPIDRPRYKWLAPKATDILIPVSTQASPGQRTDRYYLGVLGRLRPGITPALAQDRLSQLASNASRGNAAVVVGLQQELVKDVRLPLLLLTGAAAFVLLIVCANIAHLQLARGIARARELAIRVAIGAGRRRLVRQLLIESLVLASAGGLLALLAVRASLGLVTWLAGDNLPAGPLAVDGWVLEFTGLAALAAAIFFGLIPAWQASRLDPQAALKDGGRGPAGQARRTTGLLVVAEVALALVLVSGAGLMVNTLWRLQHVAPGFRTEGVVTLELKVPSSMNRDDAVTAFLDRLLARVRALPGVRAAEVANTLPMGGASTFNGFSIVGVPGAEGDGTAQYRVVTPGYFDTLGIPLRRGRIFTEADREGAPLTVVVNETMERRYFAGQALGKRILQNSDQPAEVVGVVGDIRHATIRSDPLPEVYHPLAQAGVYRVHMVIRTNLAPPTVATSVRRALAALEPNAVLGEVKTMEQRRAESLGTSRLLVLLLAAFAGLALTLALLGGYGVVNYWVSRRRQEFGVRLALGAPRAGVIRQVIGETLMLVGPAALLGLAGALACTRLLATYLYGVKPTDPTTMAVAVVLVVATTLLAAYLPARRAAATDPVVVLRQE